MTTTPMNLSSDKVFPFIYPPAPKGAGTVKVGGDGSDFIDRVMVATSPLFIVGSIAHSAFTCKV
jgi:hypothetical protein